MKYVAIEGIDGSGKTSLWRTLQGYYCNPDVAFQREPSPNYSAQVKLAQASLAAHEKQYGHDRAYNILLQYLNQLLHDQRGFLFRELESRAQGVSLLVRDRSILSNIVYQRCQIGSSMIKVPILLGSEELFPTHVILLTCDVDEALKRITKRDGLEPYDKASFLTHVQETYYDILLQPERFTEGRHPWFTDSRNYYRGAHSWRVPNPPKVLHIEGNWTDAGQLDRIISFMDV